ncbi:MAG: small-conductance mechanosensitive channel [Desulforhopalus sp.]|jgi:small-conductance mechanosensitive channel
MNITLRYRIRKQYLVFILASISLTTTLNFTIITAHAIPPETALYSDKIEVRSAAYEKKEKLLHDKIAATGDETKKKNLLLQLQLLKKLNEIQNAPYSPPEIQNTSELLKTISSWNSFDHFLDKFINIAEESKNSTEDLDNTTKEKLTLHNQLLALAEDDPEQHILQLQHAYQARKLDHQSRIDKNLKQNLKILKDQFPLVVDQLSISYDAISKQENVLLLAKKDGEKLKAEKTLSNAADDALIQEQERLLTTYLGQDLTDADKKRMHYNQLKLLELQVQKLAAAEQLHTNLIQEYEEEQKLLWFKLLGNNQNYYRLTDLCDDLNKNIIGLRKETNALPPLLHNYETKLSALRGGNAIIGPKAENLVGLLEEQIQTVGTELSALCRRVESSEHKGHLQENAIEFKQSSLTSMVTKTREATDDILEKLMDILAYPLFSYNGMTLSLLLILEILLLLLFAIVINRLYGHFIARMGAKRDWSEHTVHLVQATCKYPFIFLVAMLILSVIGINTSSLALVAGALSVGIGFGMQTIANNLVSGIILLFDKSIRPGDFISLGDGSKSSAFCGNVVQMNTRATVLRTNDNINIIIPNSELIDSKVVNWTYGDEKIRFRIPFSIAYGTDIDQTKCLIKDAILELPLVLSHPEPQILMTEHARSSLNFVAAVWVKGQHARQPARTSDTVLTKIYTTLDKHDIEIPFPQMDLRLRDNSPEQTNHVKIITDRLHEKARHEHSCHVS